MKAQFKTYTYDRMYDGGQDEFGRDIFGYEGLEEVLNDCEILQYVTVNNEIMAVVRHGSEVIDVELDRLVMPE